MWPGSFFNETETVDISQGTPEAAKAAMPDTKWWNSHAFGFEMTEATQKRFVADDGEERWLAVGSRRLGRWYFGEAMSLEDVAVVNVVEDGKHDILLANMRGNDWSTVVRTIAGNFQPIEDGDVVLPASEHPYAEARAES